VFKYIVAFALFSPLLGIYFIEGGSYAYSVGKDGYPNGAFNAFSLFVCIVLMFAFAVILITKRNRKRNLSNYLIGNTEQEENKLQSKYFSFSTKLIAIHLILLLIMLFGFGGIKVWLGIMDKGQFRIALGPFGAFAYIMMKIASPSLFAYSTLQYKKVKRNFINNSLWRLNLVIILILGSVWGFKSTGISMLLPSIIIMFWTISFTNVLKLSFGFFGLLLLFFYFFDSDGVFGMDAVIFIFDRLTTFQGDVSWHIWGLYTNGEQFPNYFPTLFSAFGDSTLKIFGVVRENLFMWMNYHYDWMLIYLAGLPLEAIDNGHNIVGTPFSEGLVAGGFTGMVTFAGIAGSLIGWSYNVLANFIYKKQHTYAAIFSAYFCFYIFPWLSGGSITQLFHISNVVGFLITLILIEFTKKQIVLKKRDKLDLIQ
jgi:hypothetical protein